MAFRIEQVKRPILNCEMDSKAVIDRVGQFIGTVICKTYDVPEHQECKVVDQFICGLKHNTQVSLR